MKGSDECANFKYVPEEFVLRTKSLNKKYKLQIWIDNAHMPVILDCEKFSINATAINEDSSGNIYSQEFTHSGPNIETRDVHSIVSEHNCKF